jgi:hypothetical protein
MSIQVGIGIGTEHDPRTAVYTAANQAKQNLRSEKIDLALVFSSIEFSHSSVLKIVSSLLGAPPILGCSSFALITHQGILKYGIAVMLFSLPQNTFVNSAAVQNVSAKSITAVGEELGEKLLKGFAHMPRDCGVVFSDGLIKNESELALGVQERLGASFPLMGALASDNLTFKKTYLYCDTEALTDAVSGLLWGGRLHFGFGVQHGWKPLGKPRYVTRSSANILHEIDNAPAASIYKEYLAADLDALQKELKHISVLYPIGIYLPGEEEYLLRNIGSITDDGSLVTQGNIPEGSMVRLMIGTKETCLAATRHALEETKQHSLGKPYDFLLVFNSVSRYILLGRRAEEELQIIKEAFGATPFLGIYTFGEHAPLKAMNYQGKTRFHNQTIAALAIGA